MAGVTLAAPLMHVHDRPPPGVDAFPRSKEALSMPVSRTRPVLAVSAVAVAAASLAVAFDGTASTAGTVGASGGMA
jgi:hypothetical protein